MGEVLALAAAVCYGVTHFANGVLARRAGGVAVAVFAQVGGTLVVTGLALLFSSGTPTGPALAWGALSGAGAGLGMAFLYRGMAAGRMSVVVPISDVGAATLPVLVGIAALGDRLSPLALCGVGIALPAIWLASRAAQGDETAARPRRFEPSGGVATLIRSRSAAGVADGLLAGAGVAVMWVALAQVPAGTGLWPLVVSRAVSVVAILPLAGATRTPLRLPATIVVPAAGVGAVGTIATLLYMLATRQQLLTVAAVLSALYPVIPVVLALVFLRERLTPKQAAGLGLTAVAVCLIAVT